MNYPLLSEYEIAIKKNGSQILNLGERYEFVANRVTPIKFYNFGSGTFASVFKVKDIRYNHYALRCFLNAGDPKRIERTKKISEFLSQVNEPWLCKSRVIERGIRIKGHYFPVVVMDWTSGILINEYVTDILHSNSKIDELIIKILQLSQSLEKKGIAHGDIQSGNLLVEKNENSINLRLVDYDAMFIPSLKGEKAVEVGHSSFQHNRRTKDDFDEKIDGFSFWLMVTALEALKFDKTLWNKDMSGGFNDGDNFLFRAKDIATPHASILVSRLRNLRQPSVDYYLDKLLSNTSSPSRSELKLYGNAIQLHKPTTVTLSKINETTQVRTKDEQAYFTIDADVPNANVFFNSVSGLKLGTTPLKLSLDNASRLIIIEKNGVQKPFYLNINERNYFIKLNQHSINVPSSARRYQVFGNRGSKIDVTLKDIEEIYRSGRDLNSVFVNGYIEYVSNVPEVKAIKDRYFTSNPTLNVKQNIEYESTSTKSPVQNTKIKQQDSSMSIVGIIIVLAIIGLLIFIAANS
ncbi:hypothetical protein [Chryseobacterium sp. R2A-55]|uniref:hypothetical protein n=1 Tax=Chryseobacterium sp. R2A-55 TaxID=2744445 RepID=UPI001F16EE93|nr:hypothetical protein [Chryseobacterium sp. R2A-55]